MATERRPQMHFTQSEYFRFEDESLTKHEYHQGQVYAMASVNHRHMNIAMAAMGLLYAQLRRSPYAVRAAAQRIRVESIDFTAYPDVVVNRLTDTCSVDDPYALTDATAIIEVLSPSTARYDRGNKFEFYRELLSLRHYVLIAQDRMEVEHRWLDAQSGEWQRQTFTALDDVVTLTAIECTLSVAELYERVEF